MIIISDKDKENKVYFPRNIYKDNTNVYTVTFNNRGTNKKYTFTVEDEHLVQYDFYTFFIDFSDMPEDEYEYSIKDSNNNVVGTGLIRLNELKQENVCYEKNTEYIAYDRQ